MYRCLKDARQTFGAKLLKAFQVFFQTVYILMFFSGERCGRPNQPTESRGREVDKGDEGGKHGVVGDITSGRVEAISRR